MKLTQKIMKRIVAVVALSLFTSITHSNPAKGIPYKQPQDNNLQDFWGFFFDEQQLRETMSQPGDPVTQQAPDPESTKILVLGDSGTGLVEQYDVARGMKKICDERVCHWALLAGDNIYENGTVDPLSPMFREKFERPYAALDLEFYAALGNHDVRPGLAGARAQIDYTNVSKKWRMPAQYYSVERDDVSVFVIDTNTINDDQAQQLWLKQSVVSATTKWKIILGHHSPASAGVHRASDLFEGFVLRRLGKIIDPLLCKYVDVYVGGHDHHLQVNQSACGGVSLVSGAAAKVRDINAVLARLERSQIHYAKGNQLGFMHLELKDASMVVQVYNQHAELMFNRSFAKVF